MNENVYLEVKVDSTKNDHEKCLEILRSALDAMNHEATEILESMTYDKGPVEE